MITYYWSAKAGTFLDMKTGRRVFLNAGEGPQFVGSVREWYETLAETMISLFMRLTDQVNVSELRNHNCKIYVPQDVMPIVSSLMGYKSNDETAMYDIYRYSDVDIQCLEIPDSRTTTSSDQIILVCDHPDGAKTGRVIVMDLDELNFDRDLCEGITP